MVKIDVDLLSRAASLLALRLMWYSTFSGLDRYRVCKGFVHEEGE